MFDNPIFVLGTPGTGTTLLTLILDSLLKSKYQYKKILWEAFNYGYFKTKFSLTESEFYQDRLNLILSDVFFIKFFEHEIKLIKDNTDIKLLDFITKKYDVVYIERKNYFEQALSYNYYYESSKNSNFQKGEFTFNYDLTKWLLKSIERYKNLKICYPSKYTTILYEDFISLENKVSFLQTKLNIDLTHLSEIHISKMNNLYYNKFQRNKVSYFDMVKNKEYMMSFKKELRQRLSYLSNI